MTTLSELMAGAEPIPAHRPWPRVRVGADAWRRLGEQLAHGRLTLVAYWGDAQAVHAAVCDEAAGQAAEPDAADPPPTYAVLSLDCADGRFPSLARLHAPAGRLERTIRDLCGHRAEDAPDERPWLDHGRWGHTAPLAPAGAGKRRKAGAPAAATAYPFLPAEGEGLHQIPVGPVHAGIIEPGHFRFTANGEAVVRLEARLGYVHKGVETLLAGAELGHAARLAGRVSGDSTVAYALAFARAAEAACGWAVPARAVWLRALMAELERVANHVGDIGAVCNDAAFALMHAHCAMLREQVLRACATAFGHRLMMDMVVPGGVAGSLGAEGLTAILRLVERLRVAFPELVALYDTTPSMQERAVGTGHLRPELARRFGCGGVVGRASERAVDARRHPGYAPYDQLRFDVPVLNSGDVAARLWVRVREVEESLGLLEQLLESLPAGPVRADTPAPGADATEGAALVEGFRGDVFAWVRLGPDGRVARCHLRDPSWFQWPLLEAVVDGNIVADFPLCNKSFNCSYSGHDL